MPDHQTNASVRRQMPKWLRRAVLALLGLGAVITVVVTRPYWDAEHYKWRLTQTSANGAELSIRAMSSSFGSGGKSYEPALRITCASGLPNLALAPLMYQCQGDCAGGVAIGFEEEFVLDRHSREPVEEAQLIDSLRAPYPQDVLSNSPAEIVPLRSSNRALMQKGHWVTAGSSQTAVRFAYPGSAAGNLKVSQQARNFIERLAKSKSLRIIGETTGNKLGQAEFDTSDLRSKLPQFWAACRLPGLPSLAE